MLSVSVYQYIDPYLNTLFSILQAHDISPSDDKMYSLNSITEAFTSTIGTSVNVQCYYDHVSVIRIIYRMQLLFICN